MTTDTSIVSTNARDFNVARFTDHHSATCRFDARIGACLLGALFLGIVAVLSLPAARADSAAFGWMPMWLIGMPLTSLCMFAIANAMPFLRLPRRRTPDSSPVSRRRRSGTVQARRRPVPATRPRMPRAA
jgi:predicted outer membrane lipoprotein